MIEFLEKYWWQLGVLLVAIITTYIKVKELGTRMDKNDNKTDDCYKKLIIHEEKMENINKSFNIVNLRLDKQTENLKAQDKEISDIKNSVVKTEYIISEIFKKFNS